MKLLLVKQDKESLIELVSFLEKEECQVTTLTLSKASEKLKNEIFDCIIISIGRHLTNELQLVEYLNDNDRKDGVIIISENTSTSFTLHCFDLGIDDFLGISFKIPILFARIKSVVRRKQFNSKRKFHFTNLEVDLQLKTISVSSKTVNFTQMEYEIVLYLLANKDAVINRDLLIQHIWGDSLKNITSYEFLFTHIKNIRKKLKLAKAEFVISNNYGVGYQIKEL